MLRLAVYTCIIGDYDVLLPPVNAPKDVDYFCFTDSPDRKVKGWTKLPLANPESVAIPGMINRYHKLFPEKVLPGTYDCSIYVDGNIRVIGDIRSFAEKYFKEDAPLVLFKHPDQSTVDEEANRCIQRGLFDEQQVELLKQQLAFYNNEGMPVDVPLTENSVIIRYHGFKNLMSAMSLWWDQLSRYASRDQLCLPYSLWKSKCSAFVIDDWTFRTVNPYFEKYEHRYQGWQGKVQAFSWSHAGFVWVYALFKRLRRHKTKLKRLFCIRRDLGLRGTMHFVLNKFSRNAIVSLNVPGFKNQVYYRRNNASNSKLLRKILSRYICVPKLTLGRGLIIDAGANAGYMALALARSYPECKIVSIEPDRDNFELLELNTAHLPQVVAVYGALRSESGTVSFANSVAPSDLFEVALEEGASSVRAYTVSDLMSMVNDNSVELMSLGVEGAEYEVFKNNLDSLFKHIGSLMVRLHERYIPGLEQLLDDRLALRPHERFTHGEYEIVRFLD